MSAATRHVRAASVFGALLQLTCSSSKSAGALQDGVGVTVPDSGQGTTQGADSGGGVLTGGGPEAGGGGSTVVGVEAGDGSDDATAGDAGTSGYAAGPDGGGDVALQAATGNADAASDGATGVAPWPPVSDYSAAGSFTPVRQNNTGPANVYDIFAPTVLGAENRKHPIISWANGTLYSVDDYQPLLLHWASYGFVVIAAQTNTTAGGGTHKAGIDWMVEQNASPASPYFGVLDVTEIGAAGHSQGGGATIAAGANEPGTTGITTTLPLMPLLSFEADQTIVSRQLVPMFNINASMDEHDPTGMYAQEIYNGAVTELVQALFIGVHEDAMNVKMQAPTVAWFRWKLMGDVQAKSFFYPVGTCELCQDPAWQSVRYKNPAP
jgi:hypothetical protein